MYNNSYFQKLLNNVQNGGQKVTVVDQKKKASSQNVESGIPDNINVMIKTSYGGGGFQMASQSVNNSSGGYVLNGSTNPNSILHANVISKALA